MTVPETSPHDAAARAADGEALLLDVREPAEWRAGHVAGAVPLPLRQLTPEAVPSGRPVIVVCRSGNRSARATAVLRAAGLDAVNLAGGLLAWAGAGLPLVTDDGSPGVVA